MMRADGDDAGAIHDLGAVALARRIRDGAVSAEEATRAALARIDRLDRRLHAFVTLDGDRAIAAARVVDAEVARGIHRGPLHGVPIAIKDLLAVAGLPTRCGTVFRSDAIAARDATTVRRLRQAGAVILGSLTLTEGAQLHHHPDVPRPANPWHPDLWTGASSSGSGVAVAAGLCHGALGTDTGGSIRMPSACCGITGLKPTWGRVSRDGLFPLAPSFDHVGPMARSVEDAAAMLHAIAGRDPADPTSASQPVPDYGAALRRGVAGLRVGVDWRLLEDGVDETTVGAIRHVVAVLADAGAIVREVALPDFLAALAATVPALTAETALDFHAAFEGHHDAVNPVLRATLQHAGTVTGAAAARAHVARLAFRQRLSDALDGVDVVALPVFERPVPDWAELDAIAGDPVRLGREITRFVLPLDASGHPTLNLPAGFDDAGRPLSVQFVAPSFREDLLVRAGHAFQAATGHHLRRPVLDG